MNKCIKRTSGGVMRISDYWLLEVVQQCQWIIQKTDSNHAQITIFGHQPFKSGFIGVDIFFVIYGYLIKSMY